MQSIINPHDKLFKEALADINNARAFMTSSIPPATLQHIDLNTIKICKDSFIDPHLKEFYSDMLYSTQMAGQLSYVYILSGT